MIDYPDAAWIKQQLIEYPALITHLLQAQASLKPAFFTLLPYEASGKTTDRICGFVNH